MASREEYLKVVQVCWRSAVCMSLTVGIMVEENQDSVNDFWSQIVDTITIISSLRASKNKQTHNFLSLK